jgi:hypothetical protein
MVGINHALDWHVLPGHDLDVGDPLLAGEAIELEGENVLQGGEFELKMGTANGDRFFFAQKGCLD